MNVAMNHENMVISNQMENEIKMDTSNVYNDNPVIPGQQNIPNILDQRLSVQIPNQIKNEEKMNTTRVYNNPVILQNINRSESLPVEMPKKQENISIPTQLLHLKGIEFTTVKSKNKTENVPTSQ